MQTLEAIAGRRSIRRFLDKPISKSILEQILHAGTLAPSAKNRQPWRFVVAQREKQGMLDAMKKGIETEKQGKALLPHSLNYLSGAEFTLKIMAQAPVTLFILNPQEEAYFHNTTMEENFYHSSNLQSIGAAIENMILAAEDLGLGSLWICDTVFAYDALLDWLGTKDQLVAALSLGYTDENPSPRPRKTTEELTQWR